jgi:hypothetical protein
MANHPGSIDRHGRVWRIRLSVGGVRHTFKLDDKTPLAEVEQYAREKDTELRRRRTEGAPRAHGVFGAPGPIRGEVTCPGRAPRTRETYQHSLDAFRTYFVAQGQGSQGWTRCDPAMSRTSSSGGGPTARTALEDGSLSVTAESGQGPGRAPQRVRPRRGPGGYGGQSRGQGPSSRRETPGSRSSFRQDQYESSFGVRGTDPCYGSTCSCSGRPASGATRRPCGFAGRTWT